MEERTFIRSPYERMHGEFINALMQRPNYHRELREFLQQFVGIHSGIEEARCLESQLPSTDRFQLKLKPLIRLEGDLQIEERQPDWIIDFLYCDSCSEISRILSCLEPEEIGNGSKRAFLHFGCSPDSYSGDIARNAFVSMANGYDVFHSIDPFEMSYYLDGGKRFGDPFFETYARIIESYAKKKAMASWQKSARAFAFLCKKVLGKRLEKRLGENLLVQSSIHGKSEATVYITLPHFEWNLPGGVDLDRRIHGLTLQIHFVSGEPFARLGLSHRGSMKMAPLGEEPISKEYYENRFFRKFDLAKVGFRWTKAIEDPLDDKFAYSTSPLLIYAPWEEENPESNPHLPPQESCGRLVNDIIKIIEDIKGHWLRR